MNYKDKLIEEVSNAEKKLQEYREELIRLQVDIDISEKRIKNIKSSSSLGLVTNILEKSGLDVELFLDYNDTFRVVTQDVKILKKLDDIFGEELKREGGGQRIQHTFKY